MHNPLKPRETTNCCVIPYCTEHERHGRPAISLAHWSYCCCCCCRWTQRHRPPCNTTNKVVAPARRARESTPPTGADLPTPLLLTCAPRSRRPSLAALPPITRCISSVMREEHGTAVQQYKSKFSCEVSKPYSLKKHKLSRTTRKSGVELIKTPVLAPQKRVMFLQLWVTTDKRKKQHFPQGAPSKICTAQASRYHIIRLQKQDKG